MVKSPPSRPVTLQRAISAVGSSGIPAGVGGQDLIVVLLHRDGGVGLRFRLSPVLQFTSVTVTVTGRLAGRPVWSVATTVTWYSLL